MGEPSHMSSLMAVTLAVTGLLWSLAFAQAQVNFYKGAWDWNWFCQNDGDCNNLGQCDLITGRCACHVTYFGQRCQNKRCPLSSTNGKVCGGHGACIQSHKKMASLPLPHTDAGELLSHGHCACEVGWSGKACDQRTCPDNCKAGNRREGTCVADTSKFHQLHAFDHNHLSTCECFPGSYGTSCQYKRCPVSPRGFECDSPSGSEVSVGALYNANNHGTCNKLTGRCECTEGNYGAACEFRICPGQM